MNRLQICRFVHKMPKAVKKSEKATTNSPEHQNGPVTSRKDNSVSISILAKPCAKQTAITGYEDDAVSVQISAPPVDGEANLELIRYMTKLLGVRKSDISLDKGHRSRNKVLVVVGHERDAVISKIKEGLS